MIDVQQEAAELALKWMIKVPTLTGELVVAGLKWLLKKIEQREPVGKQKLEKLITVNHETRSSVLAKDADMKALQRFARAHKVGVAIIKNPDKSYTLYFRAGRTDQMKQCLEAYTQYKFQENKREPIASRLNRAVDHAVEKAGQQKVQQMVAQQEKAFTYERSRERGR